MEPTSKEGGTELAFGPMWDDCLLKQKNNILQGRMVSGRVLSEGQNKARMSSLTTPVQIIMKSKPVQ